MTELPVACIHHYDSLSMFEASPSTIANQVVMSEDANAMPAAGSSDNASPVSCGGATTSTTALFVGPVPSQKKRSISLDNAHDPDRQYESFTKEELIRALQTRDQLISTLNVDASNGQNKKRIKASTAVPSPAPTVSSTSSSASSGDEESSEKQSGYTKATATKKKEQVPKALVMEAAASSDPQLEAKVEQFRKLAYQGIKAQITWRPSCKSGTARFVYACMCDEANFRAFLNLQPKDKTKGYKYDVGVFQEDILRNVLMVRIRYGYLSLNGDVRVSYNKNLSEMKITGSFGV
jgi:hypothetical protein